MGDNQEGFLFRIFLLEYLILVLLHINKIQIVPYGAF